jgi:myosin V
MEQDEYKREGIKWDFIEFPDNKDSIELIEAKPAGILCLLDDHCIAPKATDQTLAGNMYKHLNAHPRFKSGHDLRVDYKFMVNHYAGDITYETDGFLEKNRDLLHQEGIDLLNSSTSAFIRGLGSNVRSDAGSAARRPAMQHSSSMTLASSSSIPPPPMTRNTPSKTPGGRGQPNKSVTNQSVGAQFKNQLNSLLGAIDETHPHYVRCLKPNDSNVRSVFDVPRITAQLANGGVLAAVHVARAGFPVRITHGEFIARYSILSISVVQRAWQDAKRNHTERADQERHVCRVLILDCVPLLSGKITVRALEMTGTTQGTAAQLKKGVTFRDVCSTSGVQMGATKIFFRQTAFNRAEKARTLRLGVSCIKIQSAFRRFSKRRAFVIARAVVVVLQARARGRRARRQYIEKRLLHATLKLQTFVRASTKRQSYLRMQRAAVQAQAWQRAVIARQKYVQKRARTVVLQCIWRKKRARQYMLALKREAANVSALQAKIAAYEERMKVHYTLHNNAIHNALQTVDFSCSRCVRLFTCAHRLLCNTLVSMNARQHDS